MAVYDSYSTDAFDEVQERPSGLKRFFFACAGAYMRLLEACPSEHTKYVGIGATIFLTACLAVISGSFAIYTLVPIAPVAIACGLLWGALIFNLDRYIVSSIRKEGRTWHELALALPRLILAVLISIVITKPIEVELFHNQINAELFSYTSELQREAEQKLDHKLGLDSIRSEIAYIDSMRMHYKEMRDSKPTTFNFGEVSAEYQQTKRAYDSLARLYVPRIEANEDRRKYLWNKYASRVFETDANGEKRFVRWEFPQKWQDRSNQLYKLNKSLQAELDQRLVEVEKLDQARKGAQERFAMGVEEEIALLAAHRSELMAQKVEREKRRAEELPDALAKAERYGIGFPARIQVLEQMKDHNSSIWWMSNLIVLLFIMLETSPVFVKLITRRGPYDYLLSRIEHQKKIESLRQISDLNYDLNANMQLQARQQQLKE